MTQQNQHPSASEPTPAAVDEGLVRLVGDWETFPDLAERWDVPVTRIHQWVKEGRLLAGRAGERAVRAVPALFASPSGPLASLHGTAAVLRDAGYSDDEAIRWLFTPDETLPGRPIDALHEGHKTEIRRRAQALGW